MYVIHGEFHGSEVQLAEVDCSEGEAIQHADYLYGINPSISYTVTYKFGDKLYDTVYVIGPHGGSYGGDYVDLENIQVPLF